MDDYLDPLLSSSSSSPWEDAHLSQRLCWVDTAVSQANGLLSGPVGIYRGDDSDLNVSVINPNNIIGSMVIHPSTVQLNDATSSILAAGNPMHGFNKLPGEDESEQDIQRCLSVSSQHKSEGSERSFPLREVIESNPFAGSFGAELKSSCTMTMPPSAESDSIESNDSDISVFPQSVGDSHLMSAVHKLEPSSYSGVHSPFAGNGKLEIFGLQGKSIRTDDNILGNTSIDYDKLQQIESLPTALMDHNKLQNLHLPSFVSGRQIKSTDSIHFQTHQQGTFATSVGLQGPQQLLQSGERSAMKHFTNHSPTTQPQPAPADAGGSNGIVKARVRARRGQATDPHSIAERLRREKIAERMKNLQELVPNSSKADKASMLDEIIDYVKFLQLQVKVLSMSRLGATGAVVPLIANIAAEGFGSLLLGQEGHFQESQDSLALEKEVVKLMESNMTMAMQYLQNKGLCLMPVALAAAVSSRKGSSGAIPLNMRKAGTSQGFISHCNEPAVQESPNCNVVSTEEEEAKNLLPVHET